MKNSSNISHIFTTTFAFIIAAVLIITSAEYATKPNSVDAQITTTSSTSTSTTQTRLSEYAWSENIGWISFKDGLRPVTVSIDGSLNGYAWSENIGWIQFGGLSGFPSTTNGSNAKIVGNSLTGWARVVSGFTPSGVDNRGGFDGWISLSGSNYGVTINGNNFGGYAWGSDVVGWVDFSGVRVTKIQNPCKGPYGTTVPDGQNFVFFSTPDTNGTCSSEVRTCSNGVLSGSLNEISCGDTNVCTRGGKTYNAGDKVVFFAKAIAGQGQSCATMKAELTCKDGAFVDSEGNVNNLNTNLKCINNPSYIEQ